MDLSTVRFGTGAHGATTAPTGERDLCIMEAVALVAGEPWSDHPACASPVVSAFLRTWNDALREHDRDRLLPAAVWVPRLVGSRGDEATEERRAYLALDWLVRVYTPAWLDLVPSLASHAAALRALPEIVDLTTAGLARDPVRAAEEAARDAAWYAAEDFARDAGSAAEYFAWSAAGVAAEDAALAAARHAAGSAAWVAAGYAARDAAWSAARDAGVALRPTVETLQQSALDLLDRMLACGEHRHEETR